MIAQDAEFNGIDYNRFLAIKGVLVALLGVGSIYIPTLRSKFVSAGIDLIQDASGIDLLLAIRELKEQELKRLNEVLKDNPSLREEITEMADVKSSIPPDLTKKDIDQFDFERTLQDDIDENRERTLGNTGKRIGVVLPNTGIVVSDNKDLSPNGLVTAETAAEGMRFIQGLSREMSIPIDSLIKLRDFVFMDSEVLAQAVNFDKIFREIQHVRRPF
jgi:hypothetical protein